MLNNNKNDVRRYSGSIFERALIEKCTRMRGCSRGEFSVWSREAKSFCVWFRYLVNNIKKKHTHHDLARADKRKSSHDDTLINIRARNID